MKFRYKVIILNLILLSLTTGIVGFLLMRRSYRLTMDTEIKSAVTENNLVQSSVEYSLLNVINQQYYNLYISLPEIGRAVYSGMLSGEEDLYLRYDGKYIYMGGADVDPLSENVSSSGYSDETPETDPVLGKYAEKFFTFPADAKKNYLMVEDGETAKLFVTSETMVDGAALNIITCRDITGMKTLLDQSIRDYRQFTIVLLCLATLLLFVLSWLLTRPLEKLSGTTNAFAAGDYSVRSDIRSADEVGQLADRFNSMADSVEDHVEELNDMIHRREQFVADFTHEIKTPMTSIIGYADTMRSMDLSREEQQTALGYIFSEGKRLESMSMKLFDLLYLKDHPIDRKPVAAVTLAESVAASMAPLMEKSGVRLTLDVRPGIFGGDAELLKSVFINLIDNARKASKEGDVVEFLGEPVTPESTETTKKRSDQGKDEGKPGEGTTGGTGYAFSVRDHGIGISEEDQKKIFDEFYMVDKSRTRAAGGAGLGMSLVAVILERHGATIDLTSTPGEGSTFVVTIPSITEEQDTESS